MSKDDQKFADAPASLKTTDNEFLVDLMCRDDDGIENLSQDLVEEAQKRDFSVRQLLSLVSSGRVRTHGLHEDFLGEVAWHLKNGPRSEKDSISVKEIFDLWSATDDFCDQSYRYCASFAEGVLRRNPTLGDLQKTKSLLEFAERNLFENNYSLRAEEDVLENGCSWPVQALVKTLNKVSQLITEKQQLQIQKERASISKEDEEGLRLFYERLNQSNGEDSGDSDH